MIRHTIVFYSIIVVLMGGGVYTTVSVSEAMAASENVEEFVQQIYFEGIPYDQASQYGPDDVPKLLAMLNDPKNKSFQSNIIVTLGIIGDDRAVEPLIEVLESSGDQLKQEDFAAKSSVLMSLGYLINKSQNEKALAYLKSHTTPQGWQGSKMITAEGLQASTDERSQQLSTLAVIGLALSGHPEAKNALRSLGENVKAMGPTTFAKQMNSVVDEAMKAHETVAKEGLAAYYQKAKQ
jgi:PBS lyase HEAT-like repeat-containing protein